MIYFVSSGLAKVGVASSSLVSRSNPRADLSAGYQLTVRRGGHLNGNRRAVEFGEREAVERFVEGVALIGHDADRDLFSEQQRLLRI